MIKKIRFNTKQFERIKKNAPKDIIIFNCNATYYALYNNKEIVSICGIIKYKLGFKIVSCFTYPRHRKKGHMYNLVKFLMKKYNSNYYYANANENSFKIFKNLGFAQYEFKQFKNFTRRVMIYNKQ
jgi:hypothetical protein